MRMTPRRPWLLPLNVFYRGAVEFRNLLFDTGLLPQSSFEPFILVVGNLRAGGSGKTPHVVALATELSKDFRVVVLSRGYKRKGKGFRWVGLSDHPDVSGDEPLEIKCRVPDVRVATDGNRRRGIRTILRESSALPEIIILDDGFQHRYVKADFSLLLCRSDQPYTDDFLLPAGNLREPASAAGRASAVCITYSDPAELNAGWRQRLRLATDQLLLFSYAEYHEGEDHKIPENTDLLLVSSIADPTLLKKHLESRQNRILSLPFPDHHSYSEKDVQHIISTFKAMSGDAKRIVITGKDFMKLRLYGDFMKQPVVILEANMIFYDEGLKKIVRHVRTYFGSDQREPSVH